MNLDRFINSETEEYTNKRNAKFLEDSYISNAVLNSNSDFHETKRKRIFNHLSTIPNLSSNRVDSHDRNEFDNNLGNKIPKPKSKLENISESTFIDSVLNCCSEFDPNRSLCSPQIEFLDSVFGNDLDSAIIDGIPEITKGPLPIQTPRIPCSNKSSPSNFVPNTIQGNDEHDGIQLSDLCSDSENTNFKENEEHKNIIFNSSIKKILPKSVNSPNPYLSPNSNSKTDQTLSSALTDQRVIKSIPRDPKRARNADAARKSRLKKELKISSLEAQVNDLKGEISSLKEKNKILEFEKSKFTEKERILNDHISSMKLLIETLKQKNSMP
ncbi:hypothetical protein AYI69_g9645 [Smittium culicis]|uniref:BZIP domain-containing protein n=1 Tax=Smittium culicis TaxID=133412 RepID=A0A1R1XBD4_9FUNG|nr:hypothetical protein AYI69_g9645 [Smittium culicis]